MEQQKEYDDCWYKESCKEECYLCNTYLQMKWQMENSGLPKLMQQPIDMFLTEDKYAYKQLSEKRLQIVTFTSNGNNLYICGKHPGTGKTSWAVRMLHTYFHHMSAGSYGVLRGMFVSVPDLLLKLKDFQNPLSKEYKDNLNNVDLVVWDDIALTEISDYDYSQLYNYINNRIFARKSNIYTSNITNYDDLQKILGVRLASRIWKGSEVIKLTGKGVR